MNTRTSALNTGTGYTSLVPAVEQASRILFRLAEAPSTGMRLSEIADEVLIHKSKAYSILNTLMQFDLVRRNSINKTYSLGTGLLTLSNKVLSDLDLPQLAAPYLRELARETASTAFFGIISDRGFYVVAKDEGTLLFAVTIRAGHRFPLAWGAHGKAITAFLPETERASLLAGDKLHFHGHPSRLDRDRLEKELDRCRKTGFALDLGEMQSGINAAASPVFGPGGKLLGTIVLLGTFEKGSAESYGAAVARTAEAFSRAIGGAGVDTKPRIGCERNSGPPGSRGKRKE